jgi:hypothetical protein
LLATGNPRREFQTCGVTLAALAARKVRDHGQMTVLMREAGLPVPGIYD